MDSQTIASVNNPPSLLCMPVEVLLQITRNLTTPELGDLRCTCKHIESTLFPSFSREFFTKRQFMFTEFSLQALVDISKSRFSPCITHVIFSLHRPPPLIEHFDHTLLGDWRERRELLESNRWVDECVGHMTLLNTDQDSEMLVEAFSNLSNLETIGVRDFNSRSRRRDHPYVEWNSYGVRTFELNTGRSLVTPRPFPFDDAPFTDPEEAVYLSRIFLNVLRALGKARSRLQHFEVILRNRSLHDHAFNLPKYVEPTVGPVLANLRTLFLDLNSKFNNHHVDVKNVPTPCSSYFLRKFLPKLYELEHLRLNFRSYESQETNEIFTWLSAPVSVVPSTTTSRIPFPQAPQPIDLPKLRQLDIGMTAIESHILLTLIQKYGATLRSISFRKVSLLEPTSLKPEDRVNLWAKFFDQLSKTDLKLSAINLSFISQGPIGIKPVRHVLFTDTQDSARSWAGPDMHSGLRDFINYMTIDGLKYDEDSSDSSGSGSSDSDSEMDDMDNIDSDDDGEDD